MPGKTVIPFGPYHLALEEPLLVKLSVRGEEVIDASVRLGYVHKGIERLMEGKRFEDCIRLAERVCAICTQAHSQCFVQTVEEIAGVKPPRRAEYIRVIVSELNRVESHLLLLGLTAHLMGFDTLFMHIWAIREKIMQILEEITGNRVQYAINTIGGVRRDIAEGQVGKIVRAVEDVEKYLNRVRVVFERDKTLKARTVGVGVLSKDEAKHLGVVGPVLRASGVEWDVRRNDPYSAYSELEFDVIVKDEGDSWARTIVRFLETMESLRIVKQAVGRLPRGDIKSEFEGIGAGEAVGRVEAPRGELFYYVRTDGSPTPYRVKIRTPTLPNLTAVAPLLVGSKIADVPVILGSLDPCISCADRVILLNSSSGKVKKLNLFEVRSYA